MPGACQWADAWSGAEKLPWGSYPKRNMNTELILLLMLVQSGVLVVAGNEKPSDVNLYCMRGLRIFGIWLCWPEFLGALGLGLHCFWDCVFLGLGLQTVVCACSRNSDFQAALVAYFTNCVSSGVT